MIDKLAVFMEFSGYSKDELEAYLSLKFGSMTRGGLTASILSSSGYQKAKSVIFDQADLNENQQIVLEWLKGELNDSYFKAAVSNLFFFVRYDDVEGFPNERSHKMVQAFEELDDKDFGQVLAAFAELGKEEAAK